MHIQLPWQSIGTARSRDKSVFAPKLTRQIAAGREHHHSALQMGWGREVAQGHEENPVVRLRSAPRPQESQPSPISSGTAQNWHRSRYSKLECNKNAQPLAIFPVNPEVKRPHTNPRGHKEFLVGFRLLNVF